VQLAQEAGREPRFTMLETIREFALERLAESGEATAMAASHVAYMRDLAERAEPELLGPEEQLWQSRIDAELGNVRAALTWALDHDVEAALRIAASLWVYWSIHHLAEGRQWLNAALERSGAAPDHVRARAMTTEAAMICLLGDFDASGAAAAAAANLAARTGDRLWEARARWIAGGSQWLIGNAKGGIPEMDRALVLFAGAETASGRAHAAYATWNRAWVAVTAGEVEQGHAIFKRALEMVRESGSGTISIMLLSDYAAWLISLGDVAHARRLMDEALPLVARNPIAPPLWVALGSLALIAAVDGAAETAGRLLGAVNAICTRTGVALPAYFQPRLDHAAAVAKRALGETAFAAAWATGAADPDAVLAAAIGPGRVVTGASAADGKATLAELSPREQEVLTLLIAGSSDREIAATLFISQRTASNHVSAILHKLRVNTRAEAAVHAVREGFAGHAA
jgi:DNA-binding CsgD family transcriptional regulator